MIRQIEANAKITEEMRLEAIEEVVPYETVQAVVAAHGLQRERKRQLSGEMGLLLGIGMNLLSHLSLAQVLRSMVQGLRYLCPQLQPASKGAICQLRYQQGARPMVDLFHRVCRPMASPETPGAFVGGLRLMGIDGTDETLADTPVNAAVFGRHTSGRGEAGFPQGQVVLLVELGTHAIVDAGIWPVHTGEQLGAKRLLRSVGAGMLVLWDAGLHSYAMIERTLARGAHFLSRVPVNLQLEWVRPLPDGSWLVYLPEVNAKGRRTGRKRLLRWIEYTVSDPALPGYGERRRLLTSLLDATRFPAHALVLVYHERWEVEVTIDETDTHQRLPYRPFRSQRPVGLIQEFYGLLIAHYILRKIMFDAAQLAQIDPDRISFTNALCVLRQAIPEFQLTHPRHRPALYTRLVQDVATFRLPPRKTRSNPRVVKRKMSNFDKKRPEHRLWPQPSRSFHQAIVLTKPYWG